MLPAQPYHLAALYFKQVLLVGCRSTGQYAVGVRQPWLPIRRAPWDEGRCASLHAGSVLRLSRPASPATCPLGGTWSMRHPASLGPTRRMLHLRTHGNRRRVAAVGVPPHPRQLVGSSAGLGRRMATALTRQLVVVYSHPLGSSVSGKTTKNKLVLELVIKQSHPSTVLSTCQTLHCKPSRCTTQLLWCTRCSFRCLNVHPTLHQRFQ
jgi:hypothetical protein